MARRGRLGLIGDVNDFDSAARMAHHACTTTLCNANPPKMSRGERRPFRDRSPGPQDGMSDRGGAPWSSFQLGLVGMSKASRQDDYVESGVHIVVEGGCSGRRTSAEASCFPVLVNLWPLSPPMRFMDKRGQGKRSPHRGLNPVLAILRLTPPTDPCMEMSGAGRASRGRWAQGRPRRAVFGTVTHVSIPGCRWLVPRTRFMVAVSMSLPIWLICCKSV